MAFQRQTKFKDGKKVSTEEEEYTEAKNDPLYVKGFLKDWESCRIRPPGPQSVIDSILQDKLKYVFYRAGRKGAKTTTGIDLTWIAANLEPNRVVYLCYPNIAAGIEIVWEEKRLQTCDLKTDFMFDKYVEKVDENKHIVRFANGSFIKLIGTWTEVRGRGRQPDFIVCDEFQDCNPAYIEANDGDLAAKEHSQCVFMGTPPKKRNHYEEWLLRVGSNPQGKVFHYTSYDNTSLPHLKEWLDNKKIELLKANKEDVWLREYMAELCYSSSDRILPDAKFMEKDEIENFIKLFSYEDRIPILGISIHPTYFSAVTGILIPKKTIIILDHLHSNQVWNQAFSAIYDKIGEKIKLAQSYCHKSVRQLVWDESNSFIDIVSGFTKCRKDQKWQDRGIPLLRELMVKGKIRFSRDFADVGLECQNLLAEETEKEIQKNYPRICTLAMIVNEYFSQEKMKIAQTQPFDKYQAFKDMGIPYTPPKKSRFNWG